MKQTFSILLAVVILLASSLAAVAAGEGPRLSVTAYALNVRSGPGTSYTVLDVVHSGDEVVATGQNSGWYQVQLANGRTGWVSGAFVQVKGDASGLPTVAAPAAAAASARAATPARSGSKIVFQTSSGGAIYVMNPDGSGLRFLTNGMDPALSPDGQSVAFTRWTGGNSNGARGSVWLINVDGSNERTILNDVNQPKSSAWSPDGKQIAINMQQGGTLDSQLTNFCMPYKEGDDIPNNMELINGRLCLVLPPDPGWGLRLIKVADSTWQDLPRDMHSFAPTWDPTQAWRIVYRGDQGLVNLDVNRQATWPLTSNPDQRAPVFSPDGSKIATTYRQNDHWEVHVMNADGSGDIRLTETPLTTIVDAQLKGQQARIWNNAAPAWSPDGKQIIFLSDRSGAWEIWLMNADGSNQRVLVPASALPGVSLQYGGVDERVFSWR